MNTSKSNNPPTVSVIIPVFNASSYLIESISSVINQTYFDFEIICADDCSTDNSLDILYSIKDSRIKILKNETRLGVAKNLNKLLQHTQGRYIARMDADDICFPDRLQSQFEYLEKSPAVVGVFSTVELIDQYGSTIGSWTEDIATLTPESIRTHLPKANCLAHPTAFLRASVFNSRSYREQYLSCEDWGLWMELISDGLSLHKISSPLLLYRVHSSSVTGSLGKFFPPRQIAQAFRSRYVETRKKSGKYNSYDRRVLFENVRSRLIHPVASITRRPMSLLRRLITANPVKIAATITTSALTLKKHQSNGPILFFPYCHIGGAENVHCMIAETVEHSRPLLILTEVSKDDTNLEKLKKHAKVVDLGSILNLPIISHLTEWSILRYINNRPGTTIFGSNSRTFYRIIKKTKKDHKIVDLIHAFVGKDEIGPEHWSLSMVERIDLRVFISRHAIDNMSRLYSEQSISKDLTSKFIYIPNTTAIPEYKNRAIDSAFTVIFLGRGSPEKRVHLIGKIATRVKKIYSDIRFLMIGDVIDAVRPEDRSACTFTGPIKSPGEISDLLRLSHIILLTSAREGVPLAVMEGMAHGLIPISTAVGDLPLLIQNNKNGWLLPHDNPRDIIDYATTHICAAYINTALQQEMSRCAYETARRILVNDSFAEAYREVFSTPVKINHESG